MADHGRRVACAGTVFIFGNRVHMAHVADYVRSNHGDACGHAGIFALRERVVFGFYMAFGALHAAPIISV